MDLFEQGTSFNEDKEKKKKKHKKSLLVNRSLNRDQDRKSIHDFKRSSHSMDMYEEPEKITMHEYLKRFC